MRKRRAIREQLHKLVSIERAIKSSMLSMMKQIHLDRCREKVNTGGSGPSDLGIMQPEGRPQQSKLKTRTKGIHAAGTVPRGLGMMQP